MQKIYTIALKDTQIAFSEIDYLLYSGFIIRCKKEIAWLNYKGVQETGFVFSKKVNLVYLIKASQLITIVYRYKKFVFEQNEFEDYVKYIYGQLDRYYHIPGLDYELFDPVYFDFMLAVDLPYLTCTYLEKKYLKELKVFVSDGVYVDVSNSRHYKMIQSGVVPDLIAYTNLTEQTYEERVNLLCEKFDCDSYESDGRYIILYNDTDIIRDGSHRAAILYAHAVEEPVSVRRMIFSKNYYTFERYFQENKTELKFESLLQCTVNTRWLMVNGKKTRIMRSDLINGITLHDIEVLRKNGIRTLINLTTKANTQLFGRGFEYYNVPISYLNSVLDTDCSEYYSSVDYYMYIISQHEQIREIFNLIKNCEYGVIIYCTIGRDRTGVICALLQMLLGCKISEIIEEYSLTDEIYKDKPIGVEKGFSGDAARSYMIRFLHRFEEEYHSAEEYFLRLGFDKKDIDHICKRITGD